jgi:hypothetical protein
MKKFIKTIVSLTAASAMLLSTTAFAAVTTQTVTKYSSDAGTTVTSTVSGLTEGSMVTYLAHKDAAVSETGDNIVYIGQETVDSTKSAKFEYTVKDINTAGTYATVKYGSNVDAITDTNTIEVGNVTVVWNGAVGTVAGDTLVGNGDTTTLTITAAANSEIVAIDVAGTQVDPANATVTAKAGQTVTITAAATNADAAVYQFVGAKVESEPVEGVYTNSGIVRVIGSVDKLYFTFNGGAYTMGGEVADGQFVVDDVNGTGYYGVEIEDTEDVSGFSVEAHAVVGSTEIDVVEIQ